MSLVSIFTQFSMDLILTSRYAIDSKTAGHVQIKW